MSWFLTRLSHITGHVQVDDMTCGTIVARDESDVLRYSACPTEVGVRQKKLKNYRGESPFNIYINTGEAVLKYISKDV